MIEEFARAKNERLMTIGPAKAEFIIGKLAQSPPGPKIFLEFGSYVGYSATVLAGALRDLNNGYPVKYLSFEVNPVNAAITTSFVELAGLQDVVHVFVGSASESLKLLAKEQKLIPGTADFILLDHFKNFYLPDLKLVEELGILKKGSVIFADNCGPARWKPEERVEARHQAILEYVDYVTKEAPEEVDDFIYKSELIDFGHVRSPG